MMKKGGNWLTWVVLGLVIFLNWDKVSTMFKKKDDSTTAQADTENEENDLLA